MPAWATVVLTLGATALAVAGTLLGTWLQLRHARGEQEKLAETARRERAAEILGRVRTLLEDLEPARVGVNVNGETTPAQLSDLAQRWLPLRDELSVFAAADEDPRVTDAAGRLAVAVSNTQNRVAWHVSDLLGRQSSMLSAQAMLDILDQAKEEHRRANLLVRVVLDLVRGRDVADLEARLEQIDALVLARQQRATA